MRPHYEALTTEGCSPVFAPQSKNEKCIEIDAKDDAEWQLIKEKIGWHKDSSRELQHANHLSSNNVRKSTLGFPPNRNL